MEKRTLISALLPLLMVSTASAQNPVPTAPAAPVGGKGNVAPAANQAPGVPGNPAPGVPGNPAPGAPGNPPPAGNPAAPGTGSLAGNPTPSPIGTPPNAATPKYPEKIGGRDLKMWILELKNSQDSAIRHAAVLALPMFGPSARKEALKPLIAAVRDADTGVKVSAIIALGQIGADDDKEAKEIAEALSLALNSAAPGGPIRLQAAKALSGYGPRAAYAIPALLNCLTDLSYETRGAVADALGSVGRPAENAKFANMEVLKALRTRLKEERTAAVRLELVQALLQLGPPPYNPMVPGDYPHAVRPFLDVLQERQKAETDKSVQVYMLILSMTYDGQLLNDTNIRKLGVYLTDTDQAARLGAAKGISLLGERAKPAIPHLIEALKNEDPVTVVEVMATLASLEKVAAPAVPELEKLKKAHKEEIVRNLASQTLEMVQGRKPLPNK